MKKAFWIKPELVLPMFPAINTWIEHKYALVQSENQLIEFVHYCLNEGMRTKNEVKRQAYNAVGYTMYSIVTGKSYQSKITI